MSLIAMENGYENDLFIDDWAIKDGKNGDFP